MWNTWNRWTWSGAHTKAYTKLPRHFLFDCGVLETPQILGLEHKSKDKLQRVFSGNRGNSAPIRVGCCARYAPGQFFKEHHDGRFRWEQSICSQWKLPRELSDVECWGPITVFIYLNDIPPGSRCQVKCTVNPHVFPASSCFGRPHGFLINDSMMMTVCRCFEMFF
jgi:hypothetical protein